MSKSTPSIRCPYATLFRSVCVHVSSSPTLFPVQANYQNVKGDSNQHPNLFLPTNNVLCAADISPNPPAHSTLAIELRNNCGFVLLPLLMVWHFYILIFFIT